MKWITRRGVAALLGLWTLAGAAGAANVEDIVRDSQRLTVEDGRVSMIWWIPFEFWNESIKSNPAVPEAARVEIIGIMTEYTVVALLRARAGTDGLEELQPREELLKNTRINVDGKPLVPLPPEKIPPAVTGLLAQLKPLLAEAAGPVGQGLDFLVYPAKVDGKLMIDAARPGLLSIAFYGKTQRWHLPLGSLAPPKIDKSTGEEFPGNYDFSPYTGKKLDSKQLDARKPDGK